MSTFNTLIFQGKFTSDGTDKTISIPSSWDYMRVKNETAQNQAAADLAFLFEFQRGQTDGRGDVWTKLGTVANDPVTVGQIAANSGFYYVDMSGSPLNAPVAITAGTNAVRPVMSTGSTAGLASGSIVRITQLTEQVNLNGYDFAVDTIVANTSFRIASALATAPGVAETTGGFYRIVKFQPLFYPRFRYIANITQATSAVITVTVPSGYAVGQTVRIFVPESSQSGVSDYGMTEINGLKGTITAVNDTVATQTITVNIDSSSFTAFTFPTAAKAAVPLVKAIVVPSGMDVGYARAQSVDELSDARDNRGLIGVRLVGGAASPGGASSDVMYYSGWRADTVTNT